MSKILRITGMASGLDVDSIVQSMMKVQTAKVDKIKQDRQIIEWRQEIYRDLIGDINTFKSTYFDVLKPDNYMLSSKNFSGFDIKCSDSTNPVTANAGIGAIEGDYKIKVTNLAQKAIFQGTNYINVEEAIKGVTFPIKIDSSNNALTVDGTNITLTQKTYNSLNDVAAEINNKLASTNDSNGVALSKNVQAVMNGNNILFLHKTQINTTDPNKNNDLTLTISGKSYNVSLDTAGNFSLGDIAAQINGKLSSLKASDGTTVAAGVKADLSADGAHIVFKDQNGNLISDGKVAYTTYSGGAEVQATTAVVTSTGGSTTTATIPKTSGGNSLSYTKQILQGVNDTLTIKIGTNSPINVILHSSTNPDTDPTHTGLSYNYDSMSDSDITNEFVKDLNYQLPSGLRVESTSDNKLRFVSTTGDQINVSGNATGTLGMLSGFDINQSTDDKMSSLVHGEVKFTVNNVTFHYNFDTDVDGGTDTDKIIGAKNKTISDIIADISTKANVNISYSQLTRQFSMTSRDMGAGQLITNTQDYYDSTAGNYTGSFISTLFGQHMITDSNGTIYNTDDSTLSTKKLQGEDSEVSIIEPNSTSTTGTTIHNSTNNFSLDGINYSLKSETSDFVTLTVSSNPQPVFDRIKNFIDKYNDIIDKINQKLSEKKSYSYLPLTDDQKKDMKDDDITKWENKAKEGLLANDSTLDNMLISMRQAFYDTVKNSSSDTNGIGISLSDIGLSTSPDFTQRGKIIIDEDKLKDAIKNNGDKVEKLFTKTSSTVSFYSPDLNPMQKKQRYIEEGVFQRISDILQDNVRTTRNSNGKKGYLLELAGIKGDYSEYNNFLTTELNDKDKIINDLNKRLADKENAYYDQFSKLEAAMQQLNSQSSWLTSQLSSMNGG